MTNSKQKTAIVVLSDPDSGTQESLGRLFNALAGAYEYRDEGDEVTLLFQGTGTRWLGRLVDPEHPAHQLFLQVQDTIAGASCGCADAYGATQSVEASGFALIKDNPVPGTSGLPSLRSLTQAGFTVLTF